MLEEIGAISRENMYSIPGSVIEGTEKMECQDVAEGLKNCGYANGQNITNIRLFSCPEMHEKEKAGIPDLTIEKISQQRKIDGK